MGNRGILITIALLGATAVAVYFIQRSLKQTATESIQAAAPSAGYQAGRGAVDALFQNVQTRLNIAPTPTTV